MCVLAYLSVQQVWRQSANDPQVQVARDTARLLAGGLPMDSAVPRLQIDMSESLSPFVMIFNDAGAVQASSGRLHGGVRTVPKGVLDQVRQRGELRVTWQPENGVRIATVVVPYSGTTSGFVLVGRSLREIERRMVQFQGFVGVAWVVILAGLLALVAASEYGLAGSLTRAAAADTQP